MTRVVLVVEDDGLIRMDLSDIVTDLGFQTYEAPNADKALSVMEAGTDIDVLMTDIDMPGTMNGLSFARLVAERWEACKILVISGRYNPEYGNLPAGALFLTKSVSNSQIEAALQQLDVLP